MVTTTHAATTEGPTVNDRAKQFIERLLAAALADKERLGAFGRLALEVRVESGAIRTVRLDDTVKLRNCGCRQYAASLMQLLERKERNGRWGKITGAVELREGRPHEIIVTDTTTEHF